MGVAREPDTRNRIDAFLQRLGRAFRGTGRLYLVGGTMMVYDGFRQQTQDVDYAEDDFRRKFAAFMALSDQY